MDSEDIFFIEQKPLVIDTFEIAPNELGQERVEPVSGPSWIDLGMGFQVLAEMQTEDGQLEPIDRIAIEVLEPLKATDEYAVFMDCLDLDEWHCGKLIIQDLESRGIAAPTSTKKRLESVEDFIHKCEYCVSRFSTMQPLKTHLERHAKIQCEHCSDVFFNIYLRDWHRRTIHGVKVPKLGEHFFCRCCHLGFPVREDVIKHLEKCHLEFIKQELAKPPEHINEDDPVDSGYTRSGRKAQTYQCEKCHMNVSGVVNLRAHLQQHRNPQARAHHEYVCTACGKDYKRFAAFALHRRRHAEQALIGHDYTKAMKCFYCEESFKARHDYMTHVSYKHIVENPYKCTLCTAEYSIPRLLHSHKREVHGVLLIYKCDFCQRLFESCQLRKKHVVDDHNEVVKHMKLKHRWCNVCFELFETLHQRMLHMHIVHPGKKAAQTDASPSS